jgi:hypothetical protein
MPSPVTVTFPVKAYIRKYLIYVSDNKAEPLIFKKNDHHYNQLLTLLISRRKLDDCRYQEHTTDFLNDSRHISIKLRWNACYMGRPNIRGKMYISRRGAETFNKYAMKWFKIFGSDFILDKMTKGYTRWDSIHMLMYELMITDDDINSESFYRFFTRLKNEMS